MERQQSVSGLYYNYGSTSDEKLREYLTRYKIVIEENNGYYPLTNSAIAIISEKLRNCAINFEEGAMETESQPIEGLTVWKTVEYLVKSTSRFFLKIDIGEIFDQIHWEDMMSKNSFKAILFSSDNYTTLPDTEGEHFLISVKLLK